MSTPIPEPLQSPEILAEVTRIHEQFQKLGRAGSFGLQFHYRSDGKLAATHVVSPTVIVNHIRKDLTDHPGGS